LYKKYREQFFPDVTTSQRARTERARGPLSSDSVQAQNAANDEQRYAKFCVGLDNTPDNTPSFQGRKLGESCPTSPDLPSRSLHFELAPSHSVGIH